MKKYLTTGLILALASGVFAQESRVTQQTVTTQDNGVTRVETQTVVTHYETYLRDVYVTAGLPSDIIVQLIRLDLEILEARINLDFDRVRALIQQQIRLLNPVQVTQIRTYITSHPVPVTIPVYAQPVWVNNVNVVNNNVQVVINNEQEIRSFVQRERIKPEQLNIRARIEAAGSVKSTKPEDKALPDGQKNAPNNTSPDVKANPAGAKTDPDILKKPDAPSDKAPEPARDTNAPNPNVPKTINNVTPNQSNGHMPEPANPSANARVNGEAGVVAPASKDSAPTEKQNDLNKPNSGHSSQPQTIPLEKTEEKK